MDKNLSSICRQEIDTTRIGFNSAEFESNIQDGGDFTNSIDNMAIQKIKEEIEGRCIGNGYVIPNTVKLINRSNITFPLEALQLNYSMQVNYEFTLCNPNPGKKLECKVVTKNQIGILGRLANEKSPLVIIVPRDLCDNPKKTEILNNSEKGDKINIIVVGKKFEQNDKKITVIAEISD